MKKLVQTILPRIALYKTLIDSNYSKGKANEYMKKYMLEIIAAKKHASIVKMEKVPGVYSIYSKIFLKIIRKTDLQKSTQNHDKNHFNVTINKCLWHTACVETGAKNYAVCFAM